MRAALFISMILLMACGEPAECVDQGDCAELQICAESTCRTVACVTSSDCGMGSYCNPSGYTCDVGCGSNDDCIAGESCDGLGKCAAYGCRTTALDCAIGEQCDLALGVCYVGSACETCSGPTSTACGAGACVDFLPEDAAGDYCLMPCLVVDDPEQCPRGLSCQDLSGAGDLYCYADCPALQAELSEP